MLKHGKREESMKIKTYYLISVIATVIFCSAVPGRAESSSPSKKPLLISQSHPAFFGIDTLQVAVLQYGSKQNKDEQFYRQLEKEVKEKLQLAEIELETPTADNILIIPELRVYISSLILEDSKQYVIHIRAALARAVCLKDTQSSVFKSEIWQAIPVMQIVSAENMTAKITDLVLEQIDGFIDLYKATNPPGKRLPEESINETDSSIAIGKQVDAAEHKYVASKSSNIFHKPDCRWAQNISKENLITYKSREEAIKAGKRPCKTCNP
jgi:hypothetical protein